MTNSERTALSLPNFCLNHCMSVYQIFQMLHIDAGNGGNYAIFRKGLRGRLQCIWRPIGLVTLRPGKRSLRRLLAVGGGAKLAKSRREVSTFYFDELFFEAWCGYLKRLNFDMVWLDREHKALARFIYGHLLKRLGEKDGLYQRF